MSPNRRIFLNIIATYGRSLYALVLGIFTARWALNILGHIDYGLMGVVGGLTGFIEFFNSWVAMAVTRFYAISIGKATVATDKKKALEDCRKWYSTAVFLHTIIPVILMVIGYPIGEWAVRNFLTMPDNRVEDCVWVFRFVCVSCFVNMISVPVNAMYMAKQYIAELTIYSFVTTTLNACFLYYMLTHPAVWLKRYALFTCCLTVMPKLIITLRGRRLFPECRFNWKYCCSLRRMKQLLYFVGWWSFGCFGDMLRAQGVQVLVNKYFGPRVNASMSIATSVNAHTTTLSGAMVGAFQPAIVAACGAGDDNRMRDLSYKTCKLSVVFILIFVLPLSLELDEVLHLWLINPPRYVYGLCLIIFAITLVHQSTVGHMLAVNAKGRIAMYQTVLGTCLLMSLPLAWLFCALGWGVYSVGVALLVTMIFCAIGRVWFARTLVGMSARRWFLSAILPIGVITACCIVFGLFPRLFMEKSFARILVTSIVCEIVFLPLAWRVLLDTTEREVIKERLLRIRKSWTRKHDGD